MVVDWSKKPQVEIRTIEQAVEWGDGWMALCLEERREYYLEISRLEDKIFWLEHKLSVHEFERLYAEAEAALKRDKWAD